MSRHRFLQKPNGLLTDSFALNCRTLQTVLAIFAGFFYYQLKSLGPITAEAAVIRTEIQAL